MTDRNKETKADRCTGDIGDMVMGLTQKESRAMRPTTHVIDIPDNFMDGQQVEELLKDIHDGVSIIVEKNHYESLEAEIGILKMGFKPEPDFCVRCGTRLMNGMEHSCH